MIYNHRSVSYIGCLSGQKFRWIGVLYWKCKTSTNGLSASSFIRSCSSSIDFLTTTWHALRWYTLGSKQFWSRMPNFLDLQSHKNFQFILYKYLTQILWRRKFVKSSGVTIEIQIQPHCTVCSTCAGRNASYQLADRHFRY